MNRFKRIATVLSIAAAFAAIPSAASAVDNNDPAGSGGCHYTDKDGYDIPIHNGEDVFVDGKIVSCRNGTVIVTSPPARAEGTKSGSKAGSRPHSTSTSGKVARRSNAAR